MQGSVQTLEFEALKIHIYTAPAETISVNSTILEFADRLIAIDGQMFRQFAVEVGDVIERLGKRIDRFVISHDHPDHYAGFEPGQADGQATTTETAEVSRRQPDGSWRVVIDAPTFS